MSGMSAEDILRQEYRGSVNFVTPTFVKCVKVRVGKHTERAIEVSKGRGMDGGMVYGVSIVEYDEDTKETTRRFDLSSVFGSLKDANAEVRRQGIARNKENQHGQ